MTKKEDFKKGQIVLYKSAKMEVRLVNETVWLSQKQMAELFNKDVRTVNEHIKNVFKERELVKNQVIRKFRITADDGKTYLTNFYNLDVIISVGYRVKSKEGTKFRIWATNVLRDHILKGFTVNQQRLQQTGLQEFEEALGLIKNTVSAKELSGDEAKGMLDVITHYSDTWLLLQKYDKDQLKEPKGKKKGLKALDYSDVLGGIGQLKSRLLKRKEATDIFGRERDEGLLSILGNVEQSFAGSALYPTLESKAAHLLYFVIKNHPFTDGNKRIGCFVFLLFLKNNNYLFDKNYERKFNSNALVALALLIAESKPKQKETMIKLVMNLVQG